MGDSYVKPERLSLSDTGYDESWLQERINEDPSILGLGDLRVIQRERKQSAGGKIDFLMIDDETETMYEIEVMLGSLDESHIIRTIEYWDNERRRWPTRDHRAVIIAEEITSRFFNVIFLINKAIPIITIQLNTLRINDSIVLDFVKVLDIYEEPAEEEVVDVEPADRSYWMERSSQQSLSVVDKIIELLSSGGKYPRITYNKGHIAMDGKRQNFCWFHPRKQANHCQFSLRFSVTSNQQISEQLQEAGLDAKPQRNNSIRLMSTVKEIDANEKLLKEIFEKSAQEVGGGLIEES